MIGYYSHPNSYIPSIESRLDLSLCKLIGVIYKLSGFYSKHGELELTRNKRQTKKYKAKFELLQSHILECFYKIDITPEMKFHKVLKTMQAYLIKQGVFEELSDKGKPIDHIKTIERYLKSDDKAKKYLIDTGLIKI